MTKPSLIFNRKVRQIFEKHALLHSYQILGNKIICKLIGENPQYLFLSFITLSMVMLRSPQVAVPFLMSIVVTSCLEKLRSFHFYGRQITHQTTALSDGPNITLVSLLINQGQRFKSKFVYQKWLFSQLLLQPSSYRSLLSGFSHPPLSSEEV